MHRVGGKCRGDGRRDAAVPPGDHLAVLVEAGLDPFRRDGVEEVVTHVILPRPLHLYRRPERLRKQRRLEREVALRLAAESAAEQGDVDGDVVLGNSEGLGDVFPGPAGTLHGRPDFGLAVPYIGDRDGRLHAGMRQMRQVVFADNHLVGGLQGGVHVALLAHHQARLARGVLEFGAIGRRIVFGVGAVVPDDLQRVPSLDRSPGVAGDHGDAAERLEFGWPGPTLDLHHLFDAGDLHRVATVERYQLAAGHRRPGDHGVFHAGEPDVAAIGGGADGNVAEIDDADLALAEVAEVLRVLQFQAGNARYRLPGRVGRQVAESETAAAGRMNHLMVYGLDLAGRHAPGLGGGGFQHEARHGADLAHRNQVVARAARTVGVLIAVFGLVAMRLRHLHPRPVGLHFLGHDQRQAGSDPRSHLGAVRHDGDGPVGGDGDEDARIDHGAVRHVRSTGLVVGKCLARHHRRGQHQSAGDAEPLEKAATRDVFDAVAAFEAAEWRGMGDDVHVRPPSMRDEQRFRCAGSSRSGRCCPTSLRGSDRAWVLDFP